MMDHSQSVLKWLEEVSFKKPKKCHFVQHSVVFLGYVLFADTISTNPKKVDNVKNWPVPTTQGNYNHSWDWPCIIASLYISLLPSLTVCTI